MLNKGKKDIDIKAFLGEGTEFDGKLIFTGPSGSTASSRARSWVKAPWWSARAPGSRRISTSTA